MCGICGMIGFVDHNLLRKMCGIMSHRGPDDEGYFMDRGVGLGMRRLSVIDLETGQQPIHNEDETIQVILNGEIYNYKELTYELKAKGHKFYTNSDTEALAHLYEDLKEDCVHKLRGMFAFAIWDKKEEKLFLARDRLGIKPLYYTYQDNKFLFASEIKALLEDKAISRRIDVSALDYYLTFLYIPAPLTIFEGINKLLPGCSLTFRKGDLNIRRYWKLNFSEGKHRPIRFYKERILGSLKETVKSHLVSDVPLGVFLSGGIDSSSIVALMHQLGVDCIRTFSIGYEGRYTSYNELEYSRLVSRRFNTQHQEFIIKPDIIKILPSVVSYLDEPFADSSAILTYFISKETRQYVKVTLSGVGGDEVFGGYPRYIAAQLSLNYQKLPYFLRKGLVKFSGFIPESTSSTNAGGRIKRFLKAGLLDEVERYINWMTFFNKDMKEGLYAKDIKASLKDCSYDLAHRQIFKQCKSKSYLDRISYVDLNTYLVDDLLVMADRMSMANSLELRVPFCDHKLIEFMTTVPYNLKIKGLKLKSLLKSSLEGFLPLEVLHKPKQGFMVPLADWLREDLKGYVLEILSSENIKKRGIFNCSFIQKLLDDHFKAKRVYTHQIYALLILELWFRIYLDNK